MRQNSFATRAPTWTSLEELTALLKPPGWIWEEVE